MLRPATALLTTVTVSLNNGSNWLPHPAGQADRGFAIVESPASQTFTGAACSRDPAAGEQGCWPASAVPVLMIIGSAASTASARRRFLTSGLQTCRVV